MRTPREHPAVEAWTPEPPPPPQPRVRPGLIAGLIALLLVFGMVGVVAARQSGGLGGGASSPEAAASGLLGALDRDTLDAKALDRAARYLTGEERLAVTTWAERIARLAARPTTGGQPLWIGAFGAGDVRFQQVDGTDDVAVLEAVSGTVTVRANGAHLELSLDEARRRLAEQTDSRVNSLRVVTVRAGGRWYVALLPTALEWARLAGGGGAADYARLTADAAPGAGSPQDAVRGLLDALGQSPSAIAARLAPSERNAIDAYLPSAPSVAAADGMLGLRRLDRAAVGGVGGAERVTDGVARVHLNGGQVESSDLIAVRRDGTWYPSMVFTLTDLTLTRAERELS